MLSGPCSPQRLQGRASLPLPGPCAGHHPAFLGSERGALEDMRLLGRYQSRFIPQRQQQPECHLKGGREKGCEMPAQAAAASQERTQSLEKLIFYNGL